ncbi:MAG TPA: diguanylate cyclase [Terriglobales bacterium]|jgi:two-component system chemotaxis response regulator CheY|nr:diguanylate cyclase [Terriglobales bacterium]
METSPILRILVADDSAVYRKLVEHALSDESYELVFAKNGQEALGLYAERQPDLLITDWMMPDISGIDLATRIREQHSAPYTYIVMLTGQTNITEVVAGLAAGADDYLTKPFQPAELVARLGVGRRIIDLHRQLETKNRQLEEMALTDSLTGLPNRRAVEAWASRQLAGAARYGFPFWVTMIDVDHFKSVNDTYGHEAGDAVLKKFAEILKSNTRSCEISARMGGEEFLIVLTHADQPNIEIAIGRIRAQFEAQVFKFDEIRLVVTASFGVMGFQGKKAPDFGSLVSQADVALYSAKRKGRNRLEFANPADSLVVGST